MPQLWPKKRQKDKKKKERKETRKFQMRIFTGKDRNNIKVKKSTINKYDIKTIKREKTDVKH